MAGAGPRFEAMDARLTRWMSRHGVGLLRGSLGVVFLWFGVLKFFPGASPAEDLAARTISVLTGGAVGASVSLPVLALWECAVGAGLLAGRWMRATLALLWLQMAGTLAPLLLFPAETFSRFPFAPTLEASTS